MDMDDDDLVGQVEFDLTPEQKNVVMRAINLAAESGNEFCSMNPLLSIMQWWNENVPASEKSGGSPEAVLAEACRQFVLAHETA